MKRLNDGIDEWLTNYKKNSVKSATYDRLRVSHGLMNKYPIAFKDVAKLSTDDIQRYLNELVDDGYALSTIKKQFTLLTAYLKYACSNGYIERPIYLGVRLPAESSVRKQAKSIETYSVMEQKRLMRVLNSLEYEAYGAIMLMLEAGLRSGEAQCLTWDDVLWERKAIRINKTLVRSSIEKGLSFVQNSAKSKTSNRVIPINDGVLRMFERLAEKASDPYGYIFPSKEDSSLPISYCTVKYYLKKACEEARVKYRSAHSLRHTFATNCYNRGCNVKILSKLLGHADVSITYNIYIHLYGDALEEMRSVIS